MNSPAPYPRFRAGIWFFLIAIVLFGMAGAALINSRSSIPVQLLPTIRCLYGVLKSSPAIKSVDVYAIDDARFGFEYVFNGKNGQPAVSYVELVVPGLDAHSAFLGDKIPREVSEQVNIESSDLVNDLHLSQKCRLYEAFDNLFPQPTARATWHRIDLPKDFH